MKFAIATVVFAVALLFGCLGGATENTYNYTYNNTYVSPAAGASRGIAFIFQETGNASFATPSNPSNGETLSIRVDNSSSCGGGTKYADENKTIYIYGFNDTSGTYVRSIIGLKNATDDNNTASNFTKVLNIIMINATTNCVNVSGNNSGTVIFQVPAGTAANSSFFPSTVLNGNTSSYPPINHSFYSQAFDTSYFTDFQLYFNGTVSYASLNDFYLQISPDGVTWFNDPEANVSESTFNATTAIYDLNRTNANYYRLVINNTASNATIRVYAAMVAK